MDRQNLILLTGGTGYVGGRLLQRLDAEGYAVRCMARRPTALQGRAGKNTEVVFGDCFDPGSLSAALAGVHTAYYLVHSMGSAGSFEEKDRETASNFAEAARAANVRRIIYLGGLGEGALSPHLRSRQEVGAALRRPGVEVIEFRASIVIGSGSLSFEIIRALVERLPVMICPAWVSVAAQPIGIEDLVNYLVECLDLPYSGNQLIEIGGADQVSYKDIMREYARQRNLPRLMISVPVLTPRLSSLWLGLVTPVYARVGRKLIDSIRNPTVVRDPIALELFSVRPKGVQDMIARAIVNEDRQFAATKWSDALSSCGEQAGWGGVRFGNRIVDSREVSVDVPGDVAFLPIRQIGGKTGWYYGDWFWQVRGFVDLLMGGVRVRRGRRDSEMLQAGDALDFWRVEAFENNKRLLLAAEMKLPGRAWLEFEVEDRGSTSLIRQTAIFDPIGVGGLLYWYVLYPVHKLMFAKNVARHRQAMRRRASHGQMSTLDVLLADPRLTVRRSGAPDPDGRCVVYWIQRAQRATDNAALNAAIEAGNCLGKPVVVFFQLVPHSHHANLRHYQFLVEGLKDIAANLKKRRVGWIIRRYPQHGLLRFCSEVRPCLVIGDENPMKEAELVKDKIARKIALPFWTVDADVIVPSRLLAREHYAARTIRPKIHALLPQFLRPVGNPMAKYTWRIPAQLPSLAANSTLLDDLPIDRSVAPSQHFSGGYGEARRRLERFLRSRLRGYATLRNKPDFDATSQLSPYLHFGHIGAHTIALAVQQANAPVKDRRAYLEELIVRRELAINFVRFNANYENFEACEPWADVTYRKHAHDRRRYLYTERQLENAESHDPLWNAAQKQMVLTGWMHGYLRMYWAKKILEWTESPQAAYQIAVRLNDRYELDGRDPNGYAGIAWAIVGKHDRAWGPERPVYGKIRYMSYESTSRKFNSKAYIERIAALEAGRSAD